LAPIRHVTLIARGIFSGNRRRYLTGLRTTVV
jgi:hypothetical protein